MNSKARSEAHSNTASKGFSTTKLLPRLNCGLTCAVPVFLPDRQASLEPAHSKHAANTRARTLYLVAAVLIQNNEEHGHYNNDADHDDGVQHRVQETLAHRRGVLAEGSVDPAV